MDFHCMKRKQLQALCKKHKIPANLSNLEMANRLTDFLQKQEENVSEIESTGEVVSKKGKKVRFSPEHELIVFTRSPEIIKRSRRNSVGRHGSTMQTGELKLMEAEVKQKKRGRKAVKCNDGQKIASAVDSFEDGELETEEGDVVRSGRMMRLRGKMAAEGVSNASKREGKGAKGDDKRGEKAPDKVKNDERQEEIVENHSRVTRSRAQKLTDAPAAEEKRGRKVVKHIGKVAVVRAETGDNTDSLSKRGDESEGKSATGSDERIKGNEKELKEILVNKQITGEHATVEPQLRVRRSKRRANGVGESEMLTIDTRKHENAEVKGSRKTSKLSASGVSEVDTEIIGLEVNPGRRVVLEFEEPIQKMEPRRSNRRKTMIGSDSLRVDTLRSSLPQSDIVPEVSKDEKIVIQPIGITRRSRRKTLSLKMVSATDTDSAVENLEAEKHISESCLVEKENYAVEMNTRLTRNTSKCKPPGSLDKIGGDSNIHKKNKVMKRKRGHAIGDVIKNNNDQISEEQSLKGSSSEKVVSSAATGIFADERNQPHRLDNPNMLDASSHHDSSGIGESLFLDVQLSVSKDSENANNLCSETIISDVDLTFIRDTRKKKEEEVSVADSADSSCMNLDNEEDFVKSATNAASRSAELGIESSVSEDQISSSNTLELEKGKLLMEFDVQESVEQNITDVDKDDLGAQVYSQADDSGCNNKMNDQVLAEGLNVSGEEGSAETHSSADSFLLGDQTYVQTDLEVAETAVDERVQPCLRVDDHHNDLDHIGSPSNILDNNNEDTSQTSGEDGAFESCGTDYTHSKSTSKLKAPLLGMTRHHGDNVAEGNETLFHKGRASELAEANEGDCSKDQRNASNHFSESNMPDLCHGERDARIVSPDRGIFPGEYLVMNSDEHCTDSTCVNQKRGHEDVQITKKEERCIYDAIDSDVAETPESESSKGHKSKRDEDGEFCLANLFDEEGRYDITPQVEENFSGEHSVKNFDVQGMSYGSPSIVAPTTMCNSTGDHKANLSAEGGEAYHFENKQLELTEADESGCLKSHKSSNSQETNPSTPSSVSETKAEKQKSLLTKSSALAYANQRQGTWSNASELTENAVCYLKSSEGKISQIAEGYKDVNHGTDKEVSAEASISDVKSCPVSEIAAEKFQDTMETEHQHRNLVARQTESDEDEEATPAISRQSWTEAELQNLFGTSDEDASPGLSDTFCEGSETENMTISKNKSTAINSGILTKKQEKEREGESGIESDADIYENEFKILFATPVKVTTPYKTEETYFHDRVLDGSATSIKECSEAMKENVATGSTSNEKAHNIGYEIENNLGIGASLSDNGGDDICEDTNEVERFELLNTSTRVLSGAEYDGCEAFEDQLTHSKEECLQEINSVTEEDREDHVTALAESCLNDEATEKSFINASGSQRNFYELESCTPMSEICTISELSDTDPQKSVVPESSHLPTACSNDGDILRETLIETSSDPELAKIGSSEKGISPLSLKASRDSEESIFENDDQYDAKKLDEKVGDPTSPQDISDELHNSEVAIQESVSTGYNICRELDQPVSSDELESTCKEAKGMEMTTQTLSSTDVVAEHGSFVCGAVSHLLSNSPMHINLGYHGNGDKKSEAGEPVSSLDEEKVQDAGFELGNGRDLLSDDVESVRLEVTSTRTEDDGCEASEEQLTENTGECQKVTDFIAEDNEEKVVPLGQSCLYDRETDSDSESTEENTDSLSGTPNNLDKQGGCQDMLTDTALSESVSCKSRVDHKSEQEMIQSGEAAVELSDAGLQKSNISKNSQNVIDEGTYLLLSSASPVYDELTESTDTDDLNGAKICDEINTKAKSCQENMTNESHINIEVFLNGQSEKAGLACGLESTFLETKETGTTPQDSNNVVAPTDLSSSVCGAQMHLHLTGENNDIENLDMWKPVFNLSGDDDKKDSGRTEINPTAQIVQFPIHELHFEENVEDFENDTHIMSNLPASGYDSILRESDVADTIKEYIDSESSLPVIFENSGAGLPSDMLADTDDGFASEKPASPIYEKDIAARLDSLTPTMKISSSKDEDNVPLVDCLNTEIKEQEEAALSTRPTQVSRNAANLPERVDEEGSRVKVEGGQSWSMRKNARSILIHGTPGKVVGMADMKENMPKQKRSNMGDITAVRPAKRRALRDLQLK